MIKYNKYLLICQYQNKIRIPRLFCRGISHDNQRFVALNLSIIPSAQLFISASFFGFCQKDARFWLYFSAIVGMLVRKQYAISLGLFSWCDRRSTKAFSAWPVWSLPLKTITPSSLAKRQSGQLLPFAKKETISLIVSAVCRCMILVFKVIKNNSTRFYSCQQQLETKD